MIARNCRGHIRDQDRCATVGGRHELFADLPGIGPVKLLRKGYDSLHTRPLHRVGALNHCSTYTSPTRYATAAVAVAANDLPDNPMYCITDARLHH